MQCNAANPTRNYTTARALSIRIKSIFPIVVFILQSHVRRGPSQVLAAVLLDGGDAGQGKDRVLLHFSKRFLERKPWRDLPVTRKRPTPATDRK